MAGAALAKNMLMEDQTASTGTITLLIQRANGGDGRALNDLFASLYRELERIAHARLQRHETITLLDTVALLHEAYLRLVKAGELNVQNRTHFLAYAARTMRSIIVDFARARQAERRGSGRKPVELDTVAAESIADPADDVLRVHEALQQLENVDERLGRVVEMRYFGGLSLPEIGALLGVTERTIRRDWEKARVLLSIALK
jgi:RNA polymerase sigma factor (TIGR02999 family)